MPSPTPKGMPMPTQVTPTDAALLQQALDALELSIPMGSDVTANLELAKDAIRSRLAKEPA